MNIMKDHISYSTFIELCRETHEYFIGLFMLQEYDRWLKFTKKNVTEFKHYMFPPWCPLMRFVKAFCANKYVF